MQSELHPLGDIHVEEASCPFHEEVVTLEILLAHIGDSLETTKACTSGVLGLVPA
jgi:hypothetical protein